MDAKLCDSCKKVIEWTVPSTINFEWKAEDEPKGSQFHGSKFEASLKVAIPDACGDACPTCTRKIQRKILMKALDSITVKRPVKYLKPNA